MKRLARWLFTVCSAGSLVLCVILAAFTLDPQTSFDDPGPPGVRVTVHRGVLVGHVVEKGFGPGERFRSGVDVKWPGGSFQSSRSVQRPNRLTRVTQSLPPLIALAAVLPAAWLALYGRREYARRRRLDLLRRFRCPDCGHDIRVTPDRCPECGAGEGTEQETAASTAEGSTRPRADAPAARC